MKKLITVSMMLVTLSLGLVGCGAKTESKKDVVPSNENAMRMVTDARGEVEIPVEPKRIVDISGSSDMLSILGYEVVGTANSDGYDYTKLPSYLEDTLKDAKILGYSMQDTMDVEAIFSLNPDLIIMNTYQEKMYDQLREVAPTVMVEMAQMDWREDLFSIARVMDKEEVAKEWLTEYDQKAKKIGESIRAMNGEDTSYLAFLASGEQFFVFDGAAFGSVLYEDLGLKKPEGMPEQENISLPVVTYEGLAAIDADKIFLIGTEEDMNLLEGNSVWNGLTPVKEGNVVELPASPYFNQGYSCIGRMSLLEEIEEMLSSLEA